MAFASDKGRQGAAGVSTGYDIDNSLRFNDDDSAYLSWTPSSAGNRKTWTFSCWVKKGKVGESDYFFDSGTGTNNTTNSLVHNIHFNSDDTITLYCYDNGSLKSNITTNATYRDLSAWYHILVVWDSAQATSSNRVKLYVNGEQVTSLSTATYPSQNFDGYINHNQLHAMGRYLGNGSGTWGRHDGYLAEVNFVDGQALTPADFGETGDYGEWKPIAYAGSYGTNGFYLDFKNSGSLGNDASSNSNNWTPTNLAATDQMLDSPTNNFSVMNAVEPSSGVSATLSEGNLKTVGTTVSYSGGIASTFEQSSGKWYWEVYVNSEVTAGSNFYSFVGAATGDNNLIHKSNNSQIPSVASGVNGWSWEGDGTINLSGTGTKAVSSVTAPSAGSVLGFAIDLDNGNVYFYHNGTAQNSGNAVITGVTGLVHNPMVGVYNGSTVTLNFGQDSSFAGNKTAQGNADGNGYGDFYYTPPTGFLALCTQNLPEPTVVPSEHFNTVTYTGNASTNAITGVGFQPDFTWIKRRDAAYGHSINDVVRTFGNRLDSSSTAAEADHTSSFSSVDSDGFTLSTTSGTYNASAGTYASWNWKANGAGVTNNDGNLTTSVSANVDAGFSILTYTGVIASGNTLGHGLDKAPEMIIIKKRSAAGGWVVYHKGIASDAETDVISLDQTAPAYDSANIWNDTAPSNTVITLGNNGAVSTTQNYLVYAFHSVAQYSKVFSYTGNGSTDGTFVYCDFRPAYVMIKQSDGVSHWQIHDTVRDTYNVMGYQLHANATDADASGSAYYIDSLSNGFKLRMTHAGQNGNGSTYIGIAFAELPAKYNNAR